MFAYHDAGFTTWDLADHYGPAEDFIGEFRGEFATRHGAERLPEIQAFTKWVPRPGRMTRRMVEDAIGVRSRGWASNVSTCCNSIGGTTTNAATSMRSSISPTCSSEGKIRHLALTNFDTERIAHHHRCRHPHRLESGAVLARRSPARGRDGSVLPRSPITLLTYGTVLGGLLSEKYLGRPQPHRGELNTASLQKYKKMIDAWGGWPLFQELLGALKPVADKHQVSIANVGVRYILDRPAVAGVIVGTRLGVAQHIADNARVFGFALDAEDLASIDAVLAKSRDLMKLIGDCGDEYR